MTFGLSSRADLLSWCIVGLLGIKLIATIILLRRERSAWFDTPDGKMLWWTAKLVPLAAVPLMIALALTRHRQDEVAVYVVLMGFILIAVPVAILKRQRASRAPTPAYPPHAARAQPARRPPCR